MAAFEAKLICVATLTSLAPPWRNLRCDLIEALCQRSQELFDVVAGLYYDGQTQAWSEAGIYCTKRAANSGLLKTICRPIR